MEIEDDLLMKVDRAAEHLSKSRIEFVRAALNLALRKLQILKLEEQHAEGYAQHPVRPGEFDIWLSEQVWEEEP